MSTLHLHTCDGTCHRLLLRDQLRVACSTVATDDARRVDWAARALLADAMTCAAYCRCTGTTADASNGEEAPCN